MKQLCLYSLLMFSCFVSAQEKVLPVVGASFTVEITSEEQRGTFFTDSGWQSERMPFEEKPFWEKNKAKPKVHRTSTASIRKTKGRKNEDSI